MKSLLYICAFALLASAAENVHSERFDERFGFVVLEKCAANQEFDSGR